MPMVKVQSRILNGDETGSIFEDTFWPNKFTKDGKKNGRAWRLYRALNRVANVSKTAEVDAATIKQALNGALAYVTVIGSYYEVPGHTTPDKNGYPRPTRYSAEQAEELRNQGERVFVRTEVLPAGYEPATAEDAERFGAYVTGDWSDLARAG
jgi:hypothetical protein